MGDGSDGPQLDEYTHSLIAYKARKLVGRAGFTEDDRPDIEQDLLLVVLQRLPKFDASRASLHTFVDRVLDRGVARLLEYRRAAARDYRRCVSSLNDPVEGEDGEVVERGDLLDEGLYFASLGRFASPMADRVARQVDLDRLRGQLPPALRELWARLEEGYTITEIARLTRTSRGVLYDQLKRLKALAERAGLRDR